MNPFLEAGWLVQITASSLTSHFGRAAHDIASYLLTTGQVTVIATDSHNIHHRPPALKSGLIAATDLVGH